MKKFMKCYRNKRGDLEKYIEPMYLLIYIIFWIPLLLITIYLLFESLMIDWFFITKEDYYKEKLKELKGGDKNGSF